MAFVPILILSGSLALACFVVGNLPLFFMFSKLRIAQLSTIGVGLLLGAALGVIIPEGVETVFLSQPSKPDRIVALALLSGFILMLLIEQLILSSTDENNAYQIAPSSPSHNRSNANLPTASPRDPISMPASTPRLENGVTENANRISQDVNARRARSITLGLVIHSLSDGIALGASSFSTSLRNHSRRTFDAHLYPPSAALATHHSSAPPLPSPALHSTTESFEEFKNEHLTALVFAALLIHKLPTALALSTSLMPLISPRKIRLHVGFFALATPIGALLSFVLLVLFDTTLLGNSADNKDLWAGIALTFSGGTFLYVATVLQSVRHESSSGGGHHGGQGHVHPGEEELAQLGNKWRVLLIVTGMVIPILVGSILGHRHG